MRFAFFLLTIPLIVSSCYRASTTIEPRLKEPSHPKEQQRETRGPCTLPTNFSCSPFSPLTPSETCEEWGKELAIALYFAEDFDLFRAITGFKRALFLLPPQCSERRVEIQYDIALAYYLGKKYVETIHEIQCSELISVDASFVAFRDLLLILYDSYNHVGEIRQADHIFSLIEQCDCESAEKLTLLSALQRGDLCFLEQEGSGARSYFCDYLDCYQSEAKSVRKAEWLNAFLPGAGYWYVGQRETAVTAFVINALFITAGVEFILHGYEAAGLITLSFESGWYFGGIYGAGLAAKSYNEHLFECYAEKISSREKLYPLMMLKYSF